MTTWGRCSSCGTETVLRDGRCVSCRRGKEVSWGGVAPVKMEIGHPGG